MSKKNVSCNEDNSDGSLLLKDKIAYFIYFNQHSAFIYIYILLLYHHLCFIHNRRGLKELKGIKEERVTDGREELFISKTI
jgi:hypothetical protein